MNRRSVLRLMVGMTVLTGSSLSKVPFAMADNGGSGSGGGRTLFITSAIEGPNNTVSLPLYRGSSRGRTVYYIILDSSDGNDAQQRGVNKSQKLVNARGSAAVQRVTILNGAIDFPASVDFTPAHQVQPGLTGFPPVLALAGSVGESFADGSAYSPLIELPNGVILNAPQILNDSGQHDKLISVDFGKMRVTLRETDGVSNGRFVKYLSTDTSIELAAALEGSTLTPALNAAPTVGDDSTVSARTSLAAFVNGPTGADNAQRQGLNSALLDGLDPLNLLRWTPNQGRYSPLWDVHPAEWTASAIATGARQRIMDWSTLEGFTSHNQVTGPGGAAFAAAGFIVNCPIISSN